MLNRILVVFALACVAAPALAQGTPPPTDETAAAYGAAATPCLNAHNDKTTDPLVRAAMCQAGIISTDKLFADRKQTSQHEINMYHFHRAFLNQEVGGAYTGIDKVRSRRVCAQVEAAWVDIVAIVDSGSPATYHKDYGDMRGALVRTVTVCRKDFGTPAGAPPLPPA